MTAALWFLLKFYAGGVLAVYSTMAFMEEEKSVAVAWAFSKLIEETKPRSQGDATGVP